jgi:hypothetical protein
VGLGFAAALAWAAPAAAQVSFDARKTGMAGLSLHRDGSLKRYNPAYTAVPDRPGQHGPKFSIPIPLGVIQLLKDSSVFDHDSGYFNILRVVNYVLHPPVFLEIKRAPTPTNDVELTIGRNAFVADLGAAGRLVPTDRFGFGATSRLADIGLTIKGVHLGVLLFEEHDVGFQLGDSLQRFLRDADSARTNTTYSVNADGLAQAGFAPTIGYAGRIAGDSARGLYIGAAVHYYFGVAYGSALGTGGFHTGDTLFAGSNPVTPVIDATVQYVKPGKSMGHGFGGDIGFVYVSGPVEFGFGINDIGATLTWPETRIERDTFNTVGNTVDKTVLATAAQTKTKLPITYVANASLELGTNTTAGAMILNNSRGTEVHVGVEQRVGFLAVRGGVARDQRKRLELGVGAGIRLGPIGLDVGFATHSNSISNARGITMATSLAIY